MEKTLFENVSSGLLCFSYLKNISLLNVLFCLLRALSLCSPDGSGLKLCISVGITGDPKSWSMLTVVTLVHEISFFFQN